MSYSVVLMNNVLQPISSRAEASAAVRDEIANHEDGRVRASEWVGDNVGFIMHNGFPTGDRVSYNGRVWNGPYPGSDEYTGSQLQMEFDD